MLAHASLGSWIKVQRKSLDLTQEGLAEQIGYALSTVRKIEAGVLRPSREIAERLVECLAIEPDDRDMFIQLARTPVADAAQGAPAPPAAGAHGAPRAPRIPASLPVLATPLIGREQDVRFICDRVILDGTRLLTLCGAPGIGKTSLALAVAAELQAHFNGEVYFVNLATVFQPDLVVMAIANGMGIPDTASNVNAEALKQRLCGAPRLLVLDTFEHLTPAASVLADLLAHCPQLHIIVTSRSVLRLRGEQQYPVPALSVPDLTLDATWEAFTDYGAVALFVQCARAVLPDWSLNAGNAAMVGVICARLDGVPLAIELIASRIKVMSLGALASRLSNRLALLTSKDADRPARHQTLRAAIDWSYSLMSPDEQRLFAELGAFVGGWTLEAAEAACGAGCDVVDSLASLLDRSMVRHIPVSGGEPRFTMLEMVREYALERLNASADAEPVRRRMAEYYRQLAGSAASQLHGAQQSSWLDALERDHDNLRAALEWYSANDPAAGCELGAALCHFWHARGHVTEGRRWLRGLITGSALAPLARARALATSGFLAFHQGDHRRAIELSEEALGLGRSLGDQRVIAAALFNLGSAALFLNRYDQSMACYDESLAIYRALGETGEAAQILKNQGLVAKEQGDYAAATSLIEESLRLRRSINDTRGMANSLVNLSIVVYWLGQYARAATLAEEAHELYKSLGDHGGRAYILDILGMAMHKQGDSVVGALMLEESLSLFRSIEDASGAAMALNDLGLVEQALGRLERAASLQRECLGIAWRLGEQRRVAFALEGWAAVAAAGQPAWAARLCAAADAMRQAIGAPLPPSEQAGQAALIEDLRGRLAPPEWERAWAAGRSASIEELLHDEPSSLLSQAVV
ncbi:MAG TPA: tetratricopeptide repeat protein [Herpetosiphonaceae bacterium]|nr:tetratricopeptide repeat protein [Herpetosiphonaceae bacterium]